MLSIIAAFYRFIPLPDPVSLREQFLSTFSHEDLCGTMLLARGGINGTMAGSEKIIDRRTSVGHGDFENEGPDLQTQTALHSQLC